jgi:hypothetical protein
MNNYSLTNEVSSVHSTLTVTSISRYPIFKIAFFRSFCFIICITCMMTKINPLLAQQAGSQTPEVINIGSDRELFVDDFLVDRLLGKAELRLHHPVPAEVAVVHDAPWEGNSSVYHSIFKDGELYRMYYRGSQIVFKNGKIDETPHPVYICYAESRDGIHWRKPNLGLYNFKGSKQNNIILASGNIGGLQSKLSDNASFFKDDNPNASPDARYKAIVCASKPRGLLAFKSPDGIHWQPMSDSAVITDGAFDSQNLAFWDGERKEYRAYWRIFKEKIRTIRTASSRDFIHWDNHVDLEYTDSLKEELYTNQVISYYRAPQILIGFPARYIERGWSPSMRSLPDSEHREMRSGVSLRYGTALTEGLLMSSRDRVKFNRWNEAFIRPGIERPGTWNYGQDYIGWGILETKSALKGAPNELSFYATEGYWTGTSDELRRYTLRLDGFVSANAPLSGGELVTKSLEFKGKQLLLNFSTSAAGSIRIELQDELGNPLPGFALEDCQPVFGDTIERQVTWKNGSDVSSISGKVVKLRFELKDADLYSFHFE